MPRPVDRIFRRMDAMAYSRTIAQHDQFRQLNACPPKQVLGRTTTDEEGRPLFVAGFSKVGDEHVVGK